MWFPHQGTIGLSSVATFVILKFVDLVVGVRVSGEDELRGLDLSQHSEEAYSMEIDLHPVVHPAHELPQPAIAIAAAANRSGVKDKCGGSGIGPLGIIFSFLDHVSDRRDFSSANRESVA